MSDGTPTPNLTTDPPGAAEPRRPRPVIHAHDRPFWTAGALGELRMQHCGACGRIVHPPALRCPRDRSADLTWTTVTGRGTVEAWTVNLHQWLPGFPAPYIVALVRIAEDPGARVLTNVIGIEPERMRDGLPVRVVFHHLEASGPDEDDDVWLPLFEPDDEATAR